MHLVLHFCESCVNQDRDCASNKRQDESTRTHCRCRCQLYCGLHSLGLQLQQQRTPNAGINCEAHKLDTECGAARTKHTWPL